MNERIRELAEEARELATTRHPVSNIVLSVNTDLFESKFAELIVRDFVTTLERHHPFTEASEAYLYAISLIEEHFGVKE